jgi:MoxR-like ATPase
MKTEPEALGPEALGERLEAFRRRFEELQQAVGTAVVGHRALVTDTLTAIFCQGHVLLEGVPGLGKTFLVRTLSRVLGLTSGRIQCTPDLMPADILGTHVVGEDEAGHRTLRFEQGPVFMHLLLVDEINRATPKTQSALLEAMQEHAVTAGGERFPLPQPFFVLATQNPLEMEGTYPLPEAQLDRFCFKLQVAFPGAEDLVEISRRTTGFHEPVAESVLPAEELVGYQEALTHVPVADPVAAYAADLVLATHPDSPAATEEVKRFVAYGASPRGMQTLIRAGRVRAVLAGRTAVATEDVAAVAHQALRHRLILNFEGEAENISPDIILEDVLRRVPAPGETAEVGA